MSVQEYIDKHMLSRKSLLVYQQRQLLASVPSGDVSGMWATPIFIFFSISRV